MLLLLSNLWFGWATSSLGPSTSPSLKYYEFLANILGQVQEEQKKKEETCAKVKSALANLAYSKNWQVKAEQGVMSITFPNGETFVINKDCKVSTIVPIGTLSPAGPSATVSFLEGMITRENFRFQPDVSLFKTLFLLLMYAAGIFWAVRVVQRLIAGELTQMFITLFIGLIIVASMYVLYRWMP
jgi:hypothetical protein